MRYVLTIGIGEPIECVGFKTHEIQYAKEFVFDDNGFQNAEEKKFIDEIQELHPFAGLYLRHFV